MHSRSIALAAMLMLAPAAWGQPAKAEGNEAEASMERAKRAAAGPLKAIQQASKINRRRGETEPAQAAAVVATTAGASATTPAAAPARVVDPQTVDAVRELGDRVPAAAEAAPVAPIAAVTPAPAAATPLPATRSLTQTLLDTLPVQPQVLDMVEPNIPPAVLAQGPRGAEVEAELSLRADGSVAGVTLVPPVPRAWQRYIVAALERWRYEPMAEARVHRVRLVFSSPGAN